MTNKTFYTSDSSCDKVYQELLSFEMLHYFFVLFFKLKKKKPKKTKHVLIFSKEIHVMESFETNVWTDFHFWEILLLNFDVSPKRPICILKLGNRIG